MGKLVITIVIAIVCFTAGYFVGAKKLGPLEKDLSSARVLVTEQKSDITKKLEQARVRLRLWEVKERISTAHDEVVNKNYGSAATELETAKKSLDSLLGDSKGELKKDLTPIVVGLDDAKAAIDKSDSSAKTKLETLKTLMTEIQSKQSE